MVRRHDIVGEILAHHLEDAADAMRDMERLTELINLPTHFSEANALLAVAEGEREDAVKILENFTHRELADLSLAAQDLADLCDELRGHVKVLQ